MTRLDIEAEAPILWPPDAKNWLLTWCWERLKPEEKGMVEDEMVGWHPWLDGHEFEQAPGVGDGQGSLACCHPKRCRVRHNWVTEPNWTDGIGFQTQLHTIVSSYEMWEQKHMWAEMWALCFHYFNWNFGFYLFYILGKMLFKWRVLLIKKKKKKHRRCLDTITKPKWDTFNKLCPIIRLPRWSNDEESACQCRWHMRCQSDPWARKIPWSRK